MVCPQGSITTLGIVELSEYFTYGGVVIWGRINNYMGSYKGGHLFLMIFNIVVEKLV